MGTDLTSLDAAVNLHMAGRLDAAGAAYRRLLADDPALPAALHLLGVLAAQSGDGTAALRLLERARRLLPHSAPVLAHLAGALRLAGRVEDAVPVLRAALALDPALGDAAESLGAVLHALGDHPGAYGWLTRARRLRPDRTETLVNLGTVLRDARHFPQAEACFAAVLRVRPNDVDAHLALAVSRLVQGDLARGLAELEWRWKRFAAPRWDGAPLDGRRILLHTEQGFGDTIQFARYAPLVAERGGRVLLEVHPHLTRLFAGLWPGVTVVRHGDPLPEHDAHCPLMSLPAAFGTTLDRLPPSGAYLRADPAEIARWRPRVEGDGGLRVGLVWAGNPRHANDRNRSLPVAKLAPLLAVPGVRFVSLQTGDARAAVPTGVTDLIEGVRDFADTAAILAQLDLLVTVDTAAAHLAGALGRPCWLLLPFAPDWRWLLDRSDSPWYASLRLFRQNRPGDWDTVAVTVAAALRALAARQERARGTVR